MTHTKRERDALIRNGRPTNQLRLDQILRDKKEIEDKIDLVELDALGAYDSGEDYDSLDESER